MCEMRDKAKICSIILLFTILYPSMSFAIDGVSYSIISSVSNTVRVEGLDNIGSDYEDIVIPENITIDGKRYRVTSINSRAFYGCSNIKSIVIPESVTSIGSSAFQYCSNLESITLPSHVKEMGWGCFDGCTNLISIVFPEGVTGIRSDDVDGCIGLRKVSIPSTVTEIDFVLFDDSRKIDTLIWNTNISADPIRYKENIKVVILGENVTTIANNSFKDYSSLTSITIPPNVNSIGSNAFSGCSGLSTVEILSDITAIEYGTFRNCSSLITINIPSGVETIGDQAFYNCRSLSSIEIPSNVHSIGDNAFSNCQSITEIVIPDGITSIGDDTFYGCNNLTSVSIPSSLTSIGEWAFYNCSKIQSIEIPIGVTSIGAYAFYGCSSLTTIDIPTSVTSVGDWAFAYCNKLTKVIIPANLTSIGNSVFLYCSKLKIISIPPKVTSLGSNAFYYCGALATVYLYPNTAPTIPDDNVFSIMKKRKFYVFSDLVETYKNASGWKDYYIDNFEAIPNLTANDAGGGLGNWCTYYNGLADVRMPDEVAIYKASLDVDRLVLTEIEGHVVKRGEGVLLKSTNSSITLLSAPNEFDGDFSDNVLKGVDYETAQEEGKTYYVLSKKGDSFGFYKLDPEVSLGANKAYLTVENSHLAPIRSFYGLELKDEIGTGISTPFVEDNDDWHSIYGVKLNGEPLENGLYIHNGKKVFINDKSVF